MEDAVELPDLGPCLAYALVNLFRKELQEVINILSAHHVRLSVLQLDWINEV